tara:strand:- start:1679 stop:2041 length:363 start_codon:yes stop_codon:yes gene_type:complete
MAQQQMEKPDNLFYVRLTVDEVNRDPSPKNILKMQKTINALKDSTNSGNIITEDGTIGSQTKNAVQWFRGYDEKIKRFNENAELQMKKAEFEKSKTKFGDIPSIFNFLKEDSDILSNESK